MNGMTVEVSPYQIESAARRLSPAQRKQVLLFVEFLEYLNEQQGVNDDTDDADLWQAVLAHQAYRTEHPGQPVEVFTSAEAFLRATDES
jgi:hypothetical protein